MQSEGEDAGLKYPCGDSRDRPSVAKEAAQKRRAIRRSTYKGKDIGNFKFQI